MQKEASNELIGIKAHFPYFIVFFPIPVGKADLIVVNGDDPIV